MPWPQIFSNQETSNVIHFVPIRRLLKWLLLLVSIILLFFTSYFILDLKHKAQDKKQQLAIQHFQGQLHLLTQEFKQISQKNNQSETTVEVQNHTIDSLRQEIRQWRELYMDLNQNINMSRSTADTISTPASKITFESLSIKQRPLASKEGNYPNRYQFKATLIQSPLLRGLFKGTMEVSIQAVDAQNKEIKLDNQQLFESQHFSLGFKFFQKLQAEFSLQPDIIPKKITLILSGNHLKKPLVKEFEWSDFNIEPATETGCLTPDILQPIP